MTTVSFAPGQRWVSNTESELGLGVIVQASHRRVKLNFPAAGEIRTYAMDNAPLSRVHYQPGERVNTENGQALTVEEVLEANQCFIYSCVDVAGTPCVVPELDLASNVQFSKPQDRLFAGQIDRNDAFQMRCETLEHSRRLQQSNVLGLLGARVQLLPHQLYIASEVANRHAPRVLLADEVGLGKTIEAGLILHQQLISGRAQRVLVVVPDSLLHQWLIEMLRRFNLMFTVIDEARCQGMEDPGGTDTITSPEPNPFDCAQLVLCTLSFLTGSPHRHTQAVAADWDLLIVDEAHHLRWSETQVSPAYHVIEKLSQRAQGLLLLTATPEQLGVDGHFARLRLLDPDRYHDLQTFIEEEFKHQPVNQLVQTLLADNAGECLQQDEGLAAQLQNFLGDAAAGQLVTLAAQEDQQAFASALQAVIRDVLDRHGTGRVLFRNTRSSISGFPDRQLLQYPLPEPERYRLNLKNVPVEHLLTPELLQGQGWVMEDPRVQWLEQWLQQRRNEKILVICAHAETAVDLEEHLRVRGGLLSTVFHQGLSLVARDRAAAWFAEESSGAQVLISSEIGSEGRNFQFSHHLVLFDLPLNPDLLEQRIGRLDRIGQRHTVQIHAPYFESSAQAVLLRWYHEGLNAFEHTCPAGQTLFEHFEAELLQALRQASDAAALSDLVQRTQCKTADTLQMLQQGRDRLLELNSFDKQRADQIIGNLVSEEQRQQLSAYMERVFDQFGVDQDHHSTNSLIIRPGAHMLVPGFPALPEDGITATYHREVALSREDLHFLTWEHPLVSGAMDLVVSGEFGNTSFCTLKLPPLKPGTVLLEALFTLSGIAPGELQLQRFLPLTTIRVVLDGQFKDLSEILTGARLNRLVQEAPLHAARELVRHTRPQIAAMITEAEKLAENQRNDILAQAATTMQAKQQIELQRLQALAEVNPNIRPQEIHHLQGTAARLQLIINSAQLRLDAIRVAMVAE